MTKGIQRKIAQFIAIFSAIISIASFTMWLPKLFLYNIDDLELTALHFSLPHNLQNKTSKNIEILHTLIKNDIFFDLIDLQNKNIFSDNVAKNNSQNSNIAEILKSVPFFEISHKDDEKINKIIECSFGITGIKHNNIYINNQTNYNIDVQNKLNEKPDINIKTDGTPQVLVWHTHTTEAYIDKDQGFYYQTFSPRTRDNRYNVVQVGNAICKSLENHGIKCIHDTTCHDDPAYTGSYKRAENTIDRNLRKYPSIQVILDIHRDTIERKNRQKIKPTFSYNGVKGAQIMLIAGYDEDGKLKFPDWQHNLTFALQLQNQVESMHPGMARALLFKEARYNMHKSHGSLLIEVGSEVNTLKEAVYSGALLGNALGIFLNNLCKNN